MENNKKKELMRTIKFTLFSLSAGIIQIALFELLDKVFRLPWGVSYTSSLVASVVWNFTFNRKFTFKSAANVPTAMLKALLFYVWFTPLTLLGGDYLVEQMSWNKDLMTFICMCLNFVLEFLWQRFYVFKGSIDTCE
ncbi:MAG: GtrA family protein [Oscillospiraceae bacterium]|nr:GtrA family protein [Oscillospiraceae bacterium]